MRPSCPPYFPVVTSFRGSLRRGFSVVEVLVAMTIVGLVMAAITRQLVDGVTLHLKIARTMEFARNGRHLIDRLNREVVNAQSITIYQEFNQRTSKVGNSGYGNYLVMHEVDPLGTITRTIGYYLKAHPSGGTCALHRHDSADGVLAPGTLPDSTTSGTHRRIVTTVKVPDGSGVRLFRNWRNNGITVRGQFGTPEGAVNGRVENLQFSLTSRS